MADWLIDLLRDGLDRTGRTSVWVEKDRHGYWCVVDSRDGTRLMTGFSDRSWAVSWAAQNGHYLDRSDEEVLASLMKIEGK